MNLDTDKLIAAGYIRNQSKKGKYYERVGQFATQVIMLPDENYGPDVITDHLLHSFPSVDSAIAEHNLRWSN